MQRQNITVGKIPIGFASTCFRLAVKSDAWVFRQVKMNMEFFSIDILGKALLKIIMWREIILDFYFYHYKLTSNLMCFGIIKYV